MSDFFQHQQDARRRTRRFVLLFTLAVVFITLLTAVVTAYILPLFFMELGFGNGSGLLPESYFREVVPSKWMPLYWGNLLVSLICIPALIFTISWRETRLLRSNAPSVIAKLGGKRIGTALNFQERQLLNVVEEMAIASGVPVPAVYMLPGEASINSFVIGFDHSDAALCVTEGAALVLTRQEMQGLVAHEFSHILNGDMRLNTYMTGVLAGIESIYVIGTTLLGVGLLADRQKKQAADMQRLRMAMDESAIPARMMQEMAKQNLTHETILTAATISNESRRKLDEYNRRLGLPVETPTQAQRDIDSDDIGAGVGASLGLSIGIAFVVLGYLGMLLANLIRAAVCRQREYLADASAVQFTRNREGIGNVLRKIAGYSYHSHITNPNSASINHMLFAADKPSSGWTAFFNPATHPPLKMRIQKVLPLWDGTFLPVDLQKLTEVAKRRVQQEKAKREAEQEKHSGQDQTAAEDETRSRVLAAVLGTAAALAASGETVAAAANHGIIRHKAADFDITETAYIPPGLRDAPQSWYADAQNSEYSCCVVLALLLSDAPHIQEIQMQRIAQENLTWEIRCQNLLRNQKMINAAHRLPLLNIALPHLSQQIARSDVAAFKKLMRDLIAADKKLSLAEWCIYTMTSAQLYRLYEKKETLFAQYPAAETVYPHIRAALSVIARHSNQGKNIQATFNAACTRFGLPEAFAVYDEHASLGKLPAALHTIAQIRPLQKPMFIDAVYTVIRHDGQISAEETELLHTVCAAIDTPPPAIQPTVPAAA